MLTYRDYEALPNDGRRYEIHDGELSVTPAPSPSHQRFSRELFVVLNAYVRDHRIGEVFYAPIDVILADTSIVQPDIVYLANDRRVAVSSRGIEGPPTLAIEIVSPSSAVIDRHTKLQIYERHGVPYYWIGDPEGRSLEAYELAGGAYRTAARATGDDTFSALPFPDLVIDLRSLRI